MTAGENICQYTVMEAPAAHRPVITRSLPPDVAGFTGRACELEYLLAAVAPGRAVNVHTVDGMPGIGKTALVTRVAHRLAGRFPDGQFFYDLHSHTPGLAPAQPVDVLAVLLTGLGIDPRNLPTTLEGRSALWRDRLHGKRVLLVLDDAAHHAQIIPLLPGGESCLTLVTSRTRLVALDGAQPLSLDPLEPGEAAALFTSLAYRVQASSEADAVAETVRLCGYLPLAIVLLAGRLRHRPKWSVTAFAAEFVAAQDRLGELASGNRAVHAAFTLSYQDLGPAQQRLFRRIGLHPGPDLDVYAAAALDGASLATTRCRMEALYTHHLLDETAPGRYQLHDLLRAYARTLTADTDPDDGVTHATSQLERPDEQGQAIKRLLDYYEHTARRADSHLNRVPRLATAGSRSMHTAAPPLPGWAEALAWMRTERTNLFASIEEATVRNHPLHVVTLTAALAAFLRREGAWPQAAVLHQRAADTARALGDRLGEANALNDLGRVRLMTGEHTQAAELQQRARETFRDLGDRLGEANALNELGRVRQATGEHTEAADLHQWARDMFRDLGDRLGEANSLNELGRVRLMMGEHAQAAKLLQRAQLLYHDVGSRLGEANALNDSGRARHAAGEYAEAAELHQRARLLYRDLGSRNGEANALNDLGRVRLMMGEHAQAAELLQRAQLLYHDLGIRRGESKAWNNMGALLAESAAPQEALAAYRRALRLARQVQIPLDEAHALEGIAHCQMHVGEREAALASLREAVGIYHRIGAAEAKPAAEHLAYLEAG